MNPGPDVDTPGNASKMVNQLKINSPSSGLQIGEWNINHVTDARFEQIKLFLTSTHNNIDVLSLTETFLQPKVHLLLFITSKNTIINANLKLINAKIHSFYSMDIH